VAHAVEHEAEVGRPRRRFELSEGGFDEVPAPWRRFYRSWRGVADTLAPNEIRCPVCTVVLRSSWELRPGDRLYCRACMTGARVERTADGDLAGRVEY
jgi:hypothetical protein